MGFGIVDAEGDRMKCRWIDSELTETEIVIKAAAWQMK